MAMMELVNDVAFRGWSIFLFFFFSSRRRHTRSKRDWSSDVCSSDLINLPGFCQARVDSKKALTTESIAASGLAGKRKAKWSKSRGDACCYRDSGNHSCGIRKSDGRPGGGIVEQARLNGPGFHHKVIEQEIVGEAASVDDAEWQCTRPSAESRQLPTSDDCIQPRAGFASKPLAVPKWQAVDPRRGDHMSDIEV